ncbi:MAG: hypothetical protein DRP64_00540 [Verrucomicrobia bacterium]|nr:MAG: hypothetical protein DRP64_00540 [Verrucomicrobiota bacterium]
MAMNKKPGDEERGRAGWASGSEKLVFPNLQVEEELVECTDINAVRDRLELGIDNTDSIHPLVGGGDPSWINE